MVVQCKMFSPYEKATPQHGLSLGVLSVQSNFWEVQLFVLTASSERNRSIVSLIETDRLVVFRVGGAVCIHC